MHAIRRGTRPSASRCRSSADTSTPYFFAKPAAAGVGSPSGLNAADTGGPVTSSSKSVCRSASSRDARGQAARRAVGLGRARRSSSRASFSRASSVLRRAARSARAASWPGISSQPISISSSRSMATCPRSRSAARCCSAPRTPWQMRERQLPHAQDVGRALGDADAAARVEDVEQVRALQAVLERRQDQARRRAASRRTRSSCRTDRDGARANSRRRSCPDLAERVLRLLDLLAAAAPRRTSRRRPTRGRTRCRPSAGTSRCARGRR